MKTLQLVEDNESLEGYMEHNGRKSVTIFINVEKLWKQAIDTSIEYFIKEFASTYIHEMLHFALRQCYKTHPKWYLGEEYAVWALMEERIDPVVKRFYEKDLKYTKNG